MTDLRLHKYENLNTNLSTYGKQMWLCPLYLDDDETEKSDAGKQLILTSKQRVYHGDNWQNKMA